MDFCEIILISLQLTNVLAKKHVSSSDESIENLIYFKDCQRKSKETTTYTPLLKMKDAAPVPSSMDCPFPKMCCSLTCGGNDCGAQSPFLGRQMQPLQQNQPIQPPPRQPVVQPQVIPRGRKKKQPMRIQMQPPIGGRRDSGFTKEKIKNLISQDDDIRKILKDLVRVTMKKVDLIDMINSRRLGIAKTSETSNNNNSADEDELE